MRWKKLVAGLALAVAGVVGCKQTCFVSDCDSQQCNNFSSTMPKLESDPSASITPAIAAWPKPTTTEDPDRKLRFLTLQEAFAQALEHGNVGTQFPLPSFFAQQLNAGIGNGLNASFNGRTITGSDSIRAFSLDPAIFAAGIESSLSKFDAVWTTSTTWNTTDQPLQGLNQFQNGQNATVSTSLLKPLPTGGVAGITFSTQYQDLTNPPRGFNLLNPAYTPRLQFQFEQPLLQAFGIEINQLRSGHPGSILTPGAVGGPTGGFSGIGSEGILLTRLSFDQERVEFEKVVNIMLLNVEAAYWNLYNSYWTLYSQEAALRQAFEAWKINKLKIEAGSVATQDLAQARQQYESFRGQRLTALGQVLESERQLRALMGLPGEDGTRLIPIDAPTLTPYEPDWQTSVQETLTLRPELIQARNDLKRQQLELMLAKDSLRPDLRFTSTYGLSGIGNSLEGTTGNAFRSLAADKFNDWSIGLRFNYLLGYRDAHSQVRIAKLQLERSYLALQDFEAKAQREVILQYRNLFLFHKQIEIQRSQRLAAADQLSARFQRYLAGKETLDILLESQRVFATALQQEYTAIRDYNNTLAAFEFAKGTLLRRDNVVIGEGPLPQCAQVRAVEHERERAVGLVLRERANPVVQPCCDPEKGTVPVPQLPMGEATPVGALPVEDLLKAKQPLPDLQEASAASNVTGAAPQSSSSTGVLMMETPVTEKSTGPQRRSPPTSGASLQKLP